MVLLLPFVDSFQRVDLRTRAFGVPPCKLASKDGAVLSVGADVQFRIWDPVLSVMTAKDLNTAARMTAQNAMTKALLKRPLWEIQMEKLKISDQLLIGSFSRGRVGGWLLGLALPAGCFEQSSRSLGPQFTICLESVTAFEEPVVWVGL